ncbi:MAG: hypothetical protein AB1782_09230 [Cyanobacteriota bacterium]
MLDGIKKIKGMFNEFINSNEENELYSILNDLNTSKTMLHTWQILLNNRKEANKSVNINC